MRAKMGSGWLSKTAQFMARKQTEREERDRVPQSLLEDAPLVI
jgi:hypothetical protein